MLPWSIVSSVAHRGDDDRQSFCWTAPFMPTLLLLRREGGWGGVLCSLRFDALYASLFLYWYVLCVYVERERGGEISRKSTCNTENIATPTCSNINLSLPTFTKAYHDVSMFNTNLVNVTVVWEVPFSRHLSEDQPQRLGVSVLTT